MKPSKEGVARALKIGAAKKLGTEALHVERVVQAREFLMPTDFDSEADLDGMAYLPYRYMTPYERTEHFWQAYRTMYIERYQRRLGRPPGPKSPGIVGLGRRSFTAVWRARQIADAMGAPYEHFLRVHFDRADAVGSKHLPAPNQLCSVEMQERTSQAIDELVKDGRIDPLAPGFDSRFYAVNYMGDPQQDAMLDMIQAQITALGSASKSKKLARYMTVLQVISEAEAERRFGPELVASAKEQGGGFVASTPIALDALVPSHASCFGCHRQGHVICMQCPAAERCELQVQEIEKKVVARFGVADVPTQHKREGNRRRKRRQRERERTGDMFTDQERARLLREVGSPSLTKARKEAKLRRDSKRKKAGPQ